MCSLPPLSKADSKTKSILFGLCHFHAIMMERKLYGPMGFNMMYPFSIGDLRDSAVCLTNYMENSGGGKIPWQDLKYIFGEIMYVAPSKVSKEAPGITNYGSPIATASLFGFVSAVAEGISQFGGGMRRIGRRRGCVGTL